MQECCSSICVGDAHVDEDSQNERFREGIIAAIPKLRAYATSLLGSATDADDLVQEALTRAWKSRHTFEWGTNLNAWMFRILRNEFLSDASKRRRIVADVDDLMASRLACAPDQEWRVEFADVVAALSRLSNELREAVLLVVAAGHSYEDAAEICACSVTAMKQRVRRAKLRLADLTDPQAPPAWSRSRSERAPSVH